MTRAFLLMNLEHPTAHHQRPLKFRVPVGLLGESIPEIGDFPWSPGERTFDGPTLFIKGKKSKYVTHDLHNTRFLEGEPISGAADISIDTTSTPPRHSSRSWSSRSWTLGIGVRPRLVCAPLVWQLITPWRAQYIRSGMFYFSLLLDFYR